MTQIIQNNIQFNNVKPSGIHLSSGPITVGSQVGVNVFGGIINAVDIDWNNAQLNDTEINTTGDLLARINDTYLKNEIDTKVSNIYLSINEVKQLLNSQQQTFNEAIEALVERIITLENQLNN